MLPYGKNQRAIFRSDKKHPTKMRILLPFIFLLATARSQAQAFDKVVPDQDYPYNHYLALEPADSVRGALLLFPGFSQTVESVFGESQLPNVAYTNGLLTLVIAGGSFLAADDTWNARTNFLLNHALDKYQIPADKVVIGGFSAGGTLALGYTEACYRYPDAFPVQPRAVFAVDSPIDLFEIWDYFEREIARDFSEAGTNEARFIRQRMIDTYGTPEDNPDKYQQLSPFRVNQSKPGNEQYLLDVAVRLYYEVAIDWQLHNRRRSVYDANFLQGSDLIRALLDQGHQGAAFIQSERTGRRSNGLRHPHSWSIVDEVDCVQWLLEVLDPDD